jgi:hypothetical protein
MAEVVHNVPQEYWRPPAGATADLEAKSASGLVEACDRCETEFMVGARFCHTCGAPRPKVVSASTARGWTRYLEFHNIKERLGLPTASLIAFFIGTGCVLAAIAVGFVFSAQTVLDWQAVQLWRMQWLLAAAAAFIAGILLKK